MSCESLYDADDVDDQVLETQRSVDVGGGEVYGADATHGCDE